ncbi:hypothetical protein [Acinetobacter sp. YH1901141]|uniref:hypothetical protein n=1 Tax=Acinetobacter sp. YH1901141 TaxID=2601201 RepID=UPI00211DCDE9|nr:hypothetical protein [Acinetobacter sp. YH1901141]
MKIFSQSIAVVAVSILMTACANHAATSTTPTAQVEMYTSLQHRQCEPDSGLTLTEIVQRLQQAQIQVKRASVGSDGRMYAQVCGGADGKIAIVKLLYYSYKIRKKLEITHRLSRSTILYAYV